jgi:mono/diheme cytochrome c family protein
VFLVKASTACFFVVLAASVLLAEAATFHNAPPFTRTMKNAVRADSAAIRAGSGIYANYCENCHGVNGRGTPGASKLSTGPTQGATAGEVFWFISNGEPSKGMPSWGHLTARQRWQLVTYIQSLGKTKRLVSGKTK